MVMLGDNVEFVFLPANDVNRKEPIIKKGRIIEHAKSGGFIIQVKKDDPDKLTKCMNGTMCNRAESDIVRVI